MSDLWLVLLPILLTDMANPVLFALLVYLAGSPRGILLSASALAGHTVAYFGSGVVIAFGFEQVTSMMADPGPISYAIGLVLGLLLLWVAWLSRADAPSGEPPAEPPGSPVSAFTTGAIINFVGLPFALPYFAAIDQILKTGMSVGDALLALGGYNLAYMAPFLIVPGLVLILGDGAKNILERLNAQVERFAGLLLPLVLGIVGIGLTADALLYFITGAGLF